MRRSAGRQRTVLAMALGGSIAGTTPALADHTRNILLTGYWPPTNEMIRQFSSNPAQNPAGWAGGNWEDLGYDVYAFFAEFPSGFGQGAGDFEVDYQDTAADWARLIAEVRPVAIITFSRANSARGWEMEPAHQRFRLPGEGNPPGRTVPIYARDYSGERYPSDVPIAGEPIGNIRISALPMERIVDAVAGQMDPSLIDPFIAAYDPDKPDAFDFGGNFLSGYIGYLGVWHHDLNRAPDAPWRCVAAGHVHVGMGMDVTAGAEATEISLRVLIDHVTGVIPFCAADFDRDDAITSQDFFEFLTAFLTADPRADVNHDGQVGSPDFFEFLTAFFSGC